MFFMYFQNLFELNVLFIISSLTTKGPVFYQNILFISLYHMTLLEQQYTEINIS